jgi:hypothetical protein
MIAPNSVVGLPAERRGTFDHHYQKAGSILLEVEEERQAFSVETPYRRCREGHEVRGEGQRHGHQRRRDPGQVEVSDFKTAGAR